MTLTQSSFTNSSKKIDVWFIYLYKLKKLNFVAYFQVAVYPGNVLALHMSKPQGFKYTSGQYIFVNCSAVSPFQW